MNLTDTTLLRLMHLCSAGLPVGAYAFSHGLEYAIEARWLRTDMDINDWLLHQLHFSIATLDLPVLSRVLIALQNNDEAAVSYWNQWVLASRETRELRLTDTATGLALQRLLPQLDVPIIDLGAHVSFVSCFAQAANHWQISSELALLGYTWSWLENQVNAATKLLPLGQTQAQRLLHQLQDVIPDAIGYSKTISDEDIGSCLPALSIASMKHEIQYSRLFRS
jgi:urease accessory protein